MNRLLLLAAAAATVALVLHPHSGESRPVPYATSTVWDSVFTDAQVARGDSLYQALTCVKCHTATLAGGDDGSPLIGTPFLDNWKGRPLNELYDQIRGSMPPDNPKSVPREQVPDLIALILSKNGFPSGAKVLPDSLDRLKEITIEKSRP